MKPHKMPKPNEIKRNWYLIDASEHILGRVASKVAEVLMGKHQPYYSPQWDMGDHVVIINAEKVQVTGKKETDKQYYWHTGYPGGIKNRSLGKMRTILPEKILYSAVKGMLPKNRLQKVYLSKLHIYTGDDHPHKAQKPEEL